MSTKKKGREKKRTQNKEGFEPTTFIGLHCAVAAAAAAVAIAFTVVAVVGLDAGGSGGSGDSRVKSKQHIVQQ
ncbi:hypothetical protein BCON_0028g00410 [Botryotinia convoluta]|uniref:Uncharacterized protein n=1 Tax=Botryotinia convoluta TaxID=54673 RepID=A0A4Z1ILB0_9HELO|nr:hypothetical protein BCON_0028g00410 [Botryotinia convoluta]